MNKWFTSIVILLVFIVGSGFYHYYQSPVKAKSAPLPLPAQAQVVDYPSQVKPVLEQRCVVCHACYDAPCQLKMGSITGIERGANKERVYDGERLIEANLTRLFEDSHSQAQWREKDFFAMVADDPQITPQISPQISTQQSQSFEYETAAQNNLAASVIAHMLQLKQDKPLPNTEGTSSTLNEDDFPLDINREYQCPSLDGIEEYKKDYPLRGMPYALPAIKTEEHNVLMNWIAQGAQGSDDVALSKQDQENILQWERFFNQDDLQAQLMSRYLFEHLFLVHLHFSADKPDQYFKLVRSSSPPGEEIKGIYTRRPFDDPKVERVYYRILPVRQTLVHKSHMPMLLDEERLRKWERWFLNGTYEVTQLPSYKPEEASNPFITFAQIPLDAKYKYMLDEAQNTIMQFIKGPVCRGQMALNVINDYFWVVFTEPDVELVQNSDAFIQQALQKIALPAEEQSNALPTAWMNYAAMEREYLKAKAKFIEQQTESKTPVNLDLLWDGDGDNENMALTIFRHKDAATVVKGLIGDTPQTAWVLTYPLFERIHYLLVAGYDVYGNLGHQLNSRMYMDFLRMEGEFNFLSFLPNDTRQKVRNHWYRGSVSEVEDFVYEGNTAQIQTDIQYTSDEPYQELLNLLKTRFSDTISNRHSLARGFNSEAVLASFTKINNLQGKKVSLLPEASVVRLYEKGTGKEHFYTLLRHSAHTNISHLFNEEDRRLPSEDTLSIATGFLSSHPNAFLQIEVNQLADFAQMLSKLSTEADYSALMDKYGVRRTHPNFWDFADNMHQFFQKHYPVEFGYLDFNRLENR